MLFVQITVLIIAILTFSAWRKNSDFACPSVLFGLFWIFSLLVAHSYSDLITDIQFNTMLIFSIGAVLFHCGFYQGYKSGNGSIESVEIKPSLFRPLVIIMGLFFTYLVYEFMTKGVGNNLYEMLKNEDNEELTPSEYLKKVVEYTTIGVLLIFWKTKEELPRKNVLIYVVSLSVMGFLCALSTPSRNTMLQFFMPLIVVYLYTHSLSIRKQIVYLTIGLITFIGYYAYISANKYSYTYEKSNDSQEVFYSELQEYLSGSVIAFDQCLEEHAYTRSGRNTFRFFYALFDSENKESLVNDFFSYKRLSTNVYSFYDFYIRDFGPLYALLMQFLIGFFHGRAYKNRESAVGLYFLAMLSYPLVMQFFQDQYFSLTSTWIQITIVSIILFKTNLFAYVNKKNVV